MKRFKSRVMKEPLTLALNLRRKLWLNKLMSRYLLDVPIELEFNPSFMVFILLPKGTRILVMVH